MYVCVKRKKIINLSMTYVLNHKTTNVSLTPVKGSNYLLEFSNYRDGFLSKNFTSSFFRFLRYPFFLRGRRMGIFLYELERMLFYLRYILMWLHSDGWIVLPFLSSDDCMVQPFRHPFVRWPTLLPFLILEILPLKPL